MAACSAGDQEEVAALLRQGADINHANIDGLTALHQVERVQIKLVPLSGETRSRAAPAACWLFRPQWRPKLAAKVLEIVRDGEPLTEVLARKNF